MSSVAFYAMFSDIFTKQVFKIFGKFPGKIRWVYRKIFGQLLKLILVSI
jgi:hypothetical protein